MPDNRKNSSVKVNFNRGTVFLAACSQCDTAEVESLLRKGVNPNTANVDGLTALHQVSQLSPLDFFDDELALMMNHNSV